jgi:hypothetical protein
VVTYGDAFLFSAELFDPTGRYIVINIFQQSVVEQNSYDSGPYLLELETCLPDNCPIISTDGRPVWSPDGARTLWVIPEILNPLEMEDQIFLGDELLQSGEMVASGSDPFWLDNETYAFTVNPGSMALMAASINDNTPEMLLETADLAALIPELEAAYMFVTNARADPAAPDLIFLTAVNSQDNTDHVFTFNWQTGEINLVLSVEESYGGLTPHSFSPDHRWLLMRTFLAPPFSSDQRNQELFYYDMETQEVRNYGLVEDMILPTESWSNNGQWLVLLGRDFLILTAPGANYDHLVQHSFRDCTGVAWITKVTVTSKLP